jgi:hypothetical protein
MDVSCDMNGTIAIIDPCQLLMMWVDNMNRKGNMNDEDGG